MSKNWGLGKTSWPVGRTGGWLPQLKRLRVRYERRADIREGFMSLGCVLIFHRKRESSIC